MPLGSSTPKRKIYYLSPTTTSLVDNKKVVDPHFKVKMTDENGVTHTLPNEREVSGYLLSTTHGEYEWPKDSGKKVKTITVLLVDADALYKIEMGVNSNVARSIMNTIAGTKNMEKPVAIPRGGMMIFFAVTAVRPSRTRQMRTPVRPPTAARADHPMGTDTRSTSIYRIPSGAISFPHS